MNSQSLTFPQAIAKMEGFYVQGSRPQRNNNAGDLEFRPWQVQFGGRIEMIEGKPGRFTVFPNPEQGFAALKHLLGFPLYKGKTVTQALNIWAPSSENNVGRYIGNVCEWCQCKPTDVIDGLMEVRNANGK